MKKKQAQGIGLLVIIVFIIGGLSKLHDAIGNSGLIILGLFVLTGIAVYIVVQSKQEQQHFEDLVRYVLYNKLPADEAKKMNSRLMKKDPTKSQLIRNLQIMRDSIDIALSTKKAETAKSRMETVWRCHSDIYSGQKKLLSPELLSEIDQVVNGANTELHTTYYTNLANGYLEKARSLKKNKSKRKYLQLAKDTLQEGLQDESSRSEDINQILSDVKEFEASLEG
jgi:hypothetical protein